MTTPKAVNSRCVWHQPEQRAGLAVFVVADTVVIAIGIAEDCNGGSLLARDVVASICRFAARIQL
jgi:hypothetical protein